MGVIETYFTPLYRSYVTYISTLQVANLYRALYICRFILSVPLAWSALPATIHLMIYVKRGSVTLFIFDLLRTKFLTLINCFCYFRCFSYSFLIFAELQENRMARHFFSFGHGKNWFLGLLIWTRVIYFNVKCHLWKTHFVLRSHIFSRAEKSNKTVSHR